MDIIIGKLNDNCVETMTNKNFSGRLFMNMTKKLLIFCLISTVAICSACTPNQDNKDKTEEALVLEARIVDKTNQQNPNEQNQEKPDAFGAASIWADDKRSDLEIRKITFQKIEDDMVKIRKIVNEEAKYNPDEFVDLIVEFFADAHEPFHYFEADMPPQDKRGNCLESVWSNSDGFFNATVDFAEKTSALLEAAITDDLQKIKPAFADLEKSCQACHDSFVKPDFKIDFNN